MMDLDRSVGCKHGIAGACTRCGEEQGIIKRDERIAQLEAELRQAKVDLAYQTEARCRDAEDAYGKLRKVGG